MAFKIINNDVIRPQKRWGWRVVKGGWRVSGTLHPYKHLAIRRLYLIGEGWRVFLKVAFYPPAAWNFHPVFSTPGSKIRIFLHDPTLQTHEFTAAPKRRFNCSNRFSIYKRCKIEENEFEPNWTKLNQNEPKWTKMNQSPKFKEY